MARYQSAFALSLLPILAQVLAGSTGATAENNTILYFGFFFDYPTAASIKFTTELYLQSMLQIPSFDQFLSNVSLTANISDVFQYYEKPLDPNTSKYDSFYHVTAKYCGNDQAVCSEYERKHAEFINKTFEMHLVGYVFTKRTFGIRINLTEEQLGLFENEDSKHESGSRGMTLLDVYLDGGTETVNGRKIPLPGIVIAEEPISQFPVSTMAHVTVGCAPGISAVTTGPDAILGMSYERGDLVPTIQNITDPLDPVGGNLTSRHYNPGGLNNPDDQLFIVYPPVKLLATATLKAYYQPPVNESGSGNGFRVSASFHIPLLLLMLHKLFC